MKNCFFHILSIILLEFEKLSKGLKPQTDQFKSNENIMTFDRLLEENFKKHFNAQYYAAKMNISLKSLTRYTKQFYKLPPKEIIDQRRILEIKRLLKGTSLSGREISSLLNFDEATNMFKFFKKRVGMTPNEFRQK